MTQSTIAITKGVIHASLIPLLIMIFINHFFAGNYGIVMATFYIFVTSLIYKKSNKMLGRMAFNYTVLAILTFLLILTSIVLSMAI